MPVRGLDPPGVDPGYDPQQSTPGLDLELWRRDLTCQE
jgi:hypothetical protein